MDKAVMAETHNADKGTVTKGQTNTILKF